MKEKGWNKGWEREGRDKGRKGERGNI